MLPTTMNQPRPAPRQGRSAWRRITGHKVLLSLVTLFLLSLLSLVVITSIDNPINDDKITAIIKDISVDEEALREQNKNKPKTEQHNDDKKQQNDGVGEDPYKDKTDDKKTDYEDPYKTDPKKDDHKTKDDSKQHNKYKFVKRHDVVVEPEAGEDKDNIMRRESIKKAFVHAYDGYESHCFGQDEYRPSTKSCANWLNMGLTIIDSLDTMLIMGLEDHFSRARDWVQKSLDFDREVSVSVFETNIRMVGGLLTAYDFTGDKLFLLKAEECAKRLMPAFNTDSGLPKASINLRTGVSSLPSWTGGAAILAEVGTMQMEFAYLSQHVNNSVYADTALKVMDVLNKIKPANALYPMYVEVAPAKFRGGHVSLGAMGDSFYEYLLKLWLLFSKTKPLYRDMYYESADSIYKIMGQKLPKKDMFFVTEYNNGRKINKHDHLACFTGGMFALGAVRGESCPECNVPLVEDKKRNAGVMLCVNCSKQYVREKDVEEGKFKVSATSSGSTEPQKPATNSTKDTPNIKQELDAKSSAPADHSTDDFYDDEDDWVPPTEEELKEIEAARKRNDEISAKLSQKLLQGWAMIDIVCPACYTPLMRNKKKELFCVACETLVIDQKEFDPKIHTAINKDNAPTSTANNNNSSHSNTNTTSSLSKQTPSSQQTGSGSVAASDLASQKRSEHATRAEQAEESFFVSNKQARYESSEDVHSGKKTVDVTVKRLLTRLEDVSAKLETTEDLDKSKQLCAFIRECGSAIETMIAVQKALQK